MRQLNGKEIADFVKERQAKEVRRLKQAMGVQPALRIYRSHQTPVNDLYTRIKQRYGSDIGVIVDIVTRSGTELLEMIPFDSTDDSVHGVMIQLPLADSNFTDELCGVIPLEKDIDGLRNNSFFTPPTAVAIDWLFASYDVDLVGKNIVVIGHGKLVGEPLVAMWKKNGLAVTVVEGPTDQLEKIVGGATVLVSAVGQANLVKSSWISPGAYVVDAGTSVDSDQQISGDIEAIARDRDDIAITPLSGGVGPLTVAALFDNLLRAVNATTV